MAGATPAALLAQTATPDTPAADAAATTPAPDATTPAAGADTAAPSTDAPSTDTPATDTPAADAAATDKPAADTPAADTPATDTPAAPADGAAATPASPAAPGAAPAPGVAAPVGATPANPAKSAADVQVGGFYLGQSQGDWQVRCQKTADGKDPCELYQLMHDAENNPVAEVSLVPLSGKAAAGATLVAPLETDLLPGLGFRVDAGQQKAYPFSFCTQIGCFSRVAMSQGDIDALRKGSKVTVSLLPFGAPAESKVDLTLSLKGFSAAWDAVKATSPAPAAEPAKP
ncbi:invasion associated locus B family protein [Paracoccus suum]|uniref:Invasion associated locus B family protein n=2 Tax=Paracoccus suum TaxID=2259340 RepID=A0A344PPH4_9RHOB|nr:invasion associated locus B family protein [Paracoccus suum]